MSVAEVICGVLLVLALLAMSLYFGQRQLALLRHLRTADVSEDEFRYERSQAKRRLVSCALTLLLAVQMAGLLATWHSTGGEAVRQREADPEGETTSEQRFLAKLWGWQAIALLVVLFVVLVLAFIDLWATRRFGIREYRKIADARRAMIQNEVNKRRGLRNGKG